MNSWFSLFYFSPIFYISYTIIQMKSEYHIVCKIILICNKIKDVKRWHDWANIVKWKCGIESIRNAQVPTFERHARFTQRALSSCDSRDAVSSCGTRTAVCNSVVFIWCENALIRRTEGWNYPLRYFDGGVRWAVDLFRTRARALADF